MQQNVQVQLACLKITCLKAFCSLKPRRKFAEELQTLKGQILEKKRKKKNIKNIFNLFKMGVGSWLRFELLFTLHVALTDFHFTVNVILLHLCLLILLKYSPVGAWTQWIPCLQVLTTERCQLTLLTASLICSIPNISTHTEIDPTRNQQ